MNKQEFLDKLNSDPECISFADTMAVIDANYRYTPVSFKNGEAENPAGSNEGSCKLFAFALLNKLDKQQTLACFGDYYRKDVLQHPDAEDHANIRNFMRSGWQGISFEAQALEDK
ncbi:HopJ type III effector protein [Agaribacterium haliotis]|uniref:HopJ type III effector protein n=1 Tax=Agaribacterium haliotis TaxID=2013869 RepID=UPI000BB5995C|nr:HopJ type III effector protein [Agaribacterium haliotis]